MERTVITMARYIAREAVKQEIRRQGHKVHHYTSRQITEAADERLRNPGYRSEVMQRVLVLVIEDAWAKRNCRPSNQNCNSSHRRSVKSHG